MSDWRSLGWKSGRLISTPAFDRQGVGATQEAPYLPLETPDAGGGGGGLVEKTGAAAFNYTIGVNHTTNTVAITVPSDADYIGICVTATDNTAVSITSVTANSDTCTLVPDTDTGNFLKSGVNVRHSGYYRLMPDTGAINVVVTFSATLRESLVSVQCYKGVDQTTPNEGGFALTDTVGTATTEEIAPTTTTVSGDYLMGGFLGSGNDVDMDIVDEALGNGYDSNNGFDFLHSADAITGAGETLDFTHDQFQSWNGFVWVIKAAAGGGGVITSTGASKSGVTGNAVGSKIAIGTATSKTGVSATASGIKIAAGIGASKTGGKASASGVKTAQSVGVSKTGVSGNGIGQAGTVISKIGASQSGLSASAAGFKIASGVGASKTGASANVSGIKTAASIGATKAGASANAVGRKISASLGASKTGAKGAASTVKVAISTAASKTGVSGNASGAAVLAQSNLGASKIGATASATGFKVALGIGASKTGSSCAASSVKVARGTGESKTGVSGNGIGQAGTVISKIGASQSGLSASAAGFKIASGIGASKTGSKASVSGIKTAKGFGLSKTGIGGNASGLKAVFSIGQSRTGTRCQAFGIVFDVSLIYGRRTVGINQDTSMRHSIDETIRIAGIENNRNNGQSYGRPGNTQTTRRR